MTTIEEELQKAEERRAFAAQNGKKPYHNELRGLSKVGDKIYVQFVGVTQLGDLVGKTCHHVQINKETYKKPMDIFVPCTEKADCPLCNWDKEFIGYKDKKFKAKKTDYMVPIWVIDLKKKWDEEKEAFVSKKDEDGEPIQPELCYMRKAVGKNIMKAFIEFVKKEKDLTNKVVSIKCLASKTGAVGYDYEFKVITSGISPVDVAQFGTIPDKFSEIIRPHTHEEIDRYVRTGSFYEKKSKNGETAETTTAAAATDSGEDGYANLPNVEVADAEGF